MPFTQTEDASATRRPSEGPLVLVAVPLTSEPAEALKRAGIVSSALAGALVCLRVSSQSLHSAERLLDEFADPACRRSDAPSSPRFGGNVLMRRGDFLSIVAETARTLKPALVVIPDIRGLTGRCVHDLTVECEAPILLAREASNSGVIVAASDLKNPRFPVLRAGAVLSGFLHARIVFLHNFTPERSHTGQTAPYEWQPSILDRLDDLDFAAQLLQVQSDNVVTIRPTTAEALLSLVQSERPDILIVGARQRLPGSWDDSPLAAKMMDEVPNSVLVVPSHRSSPFDPLYETS